MKKRVVSALSVLLILCLLTMTVYAAEAMDLNRTGSISLNMTYQGEAVPGGSLTLYRVAEVHVDNGADYSFRFVEEYENCQVELSDLTSSGIAQALADYTASESISGTNLGIDDEGCVTFSGLELGLYLLVQPEPADGFNAANPFLVSVPGRQDDSYVYDVDASPKLNLSTSPTEPTEPSTEPPTEPTTPPKLPQTGQNNWPVPVLAVLGVFMCAIGWYLCASGRKKQYEE